MRRFILGFVTLICLINTAYAAPHKSAHTQPILHPAARQLSETDCVTHALLNEAVGVRSTEARITLGKLIASRARVSGFPRTTCAVYNQRRLVRGRVHCEFSDACVRRKKAPFRQVDIDRARRDAEVAMVSTEMNGPSDLLYFGTGGSCPVPAVRVERKGPFIFCAPKYQNKPLNK